GFKGPGRHIRLTHPRNFGLDERLLTQPPSMLLWNFRPNGELAAFFVLESRQIAPMKCFQAKAGELTKHWYIIDAENKVVGRLAAQIAPFLMGKHRPTYTPHIDTGDYVIVTNVDKVVFTGNKWHQKSYQR